MNILLYIPIPLDCFRPFFDKTFSILKSNYIFIKNFLPLTIFINIFDEKSYICICIWITDILGKRLSGTTYKYSFENVNTRIKDSWRVTISLFRNLFSITSKTKKNFFDKQKERILKM